MASGKPAGEFSLKMVTLTTSPGQGQPPIQANWEGTATGLEQSSHCDLRRQPPQRRDFQLVLASNMDNGDALSSIGQGTYESTGKHRWRTEGFFQIPDGRRLTSEAK